MGDAEAIGVAKDVANANTESESLHFGFAPSYICSLAGLLRIFNIVLGAISLGLWLPGYEHQFLGERINQFTGDTERGYGNGWKREPLNQFVLAVIIIGLLTSSIFFIALLFVKHAVTDWNRLNKFVHFGLGLVVFVGGVCASLGVWAFNENCCHVNMRWEGVGLGFQVMPGDNYYLTHCYCYLTKYLGQTYHETVKETILYDATKGTDLAELDQRWSFAAHDVYVHFADIFVIFLNSIVYFAAAGFSKHRKA